MKSALTIFMGRVRSERPDPIHGHGKGKKIWRVPAK
jgi:hypothetical protein